MSEGGEKMDRTETNRALITRAFDGLAAGEPEAFMGLFSEDMVWDVRGSSSWSRRVEGLAELDEKITGPLFARLGGPPSNTHEWIIADGDFVVVTASGNSTTVDGKPYANDYVFIFRMQDGKIAEVREYMDGAIADAALGPHPLSAGAG